MGRIALGIAAATLAMYVWGFLYWGASGLPYSTWKQSPDDAAAGRALLEHFPESGVYFLPGIASPSEERTQLYESGPTGFVILDVDGRPEFDAGIMARGFALNGVVAALLAWVLCVFPAATAGTGERLKLALGVAAIAVVLVNFGDAVWWALPWGWELARAFYHFSALAIAGAVLAYFASPRASG